MKVLVLNCGSSSVKYQLFNMEPELYVMAKGIVERIGFKDAVLKHQPTNKTQYQVVEDIPDHTVAIEMILKALVDTEHGVLKSTSEIDAVGHRIVHGGETFPETVRITNEIIEKLKECSDLAPLHNPANLKGIYAINNLLPNVPQCGVFDTAFHATIPDYAYMYGLSYDMYEKYKIRRYGFHGTSHRYVSRKACEILGVDYHSVKIITCHLGNGASIAAIKNGQSIDTSMGLTPVEGLIMGTRCGDLDLGALLYIMEKENMDTKKANEYINKKCGMLGISGISSDMRDLHQAAANGNHRAMLALKMYAYRVKKYIGAYSAVMGGLDIIVFTGGIGENDWDIRLWSCQGLEFLGVEIDAELNHGLRGKDMIISKPTSKVTVMTIGTNEELVIALDTVEKLKTA